MKSEEFECRWKRKMWEIWSYSFIGIAVYQDTQLNFYQKTWSGKFPSLFAIFRCKQRGIFYEWPRYFPSLPLIYSYSSLKLQFMLSTKYTSSSSLPLSSGNFFPKRGRYRSIQQCPWSDWRLEGLYTRFLDTLLTMALSGILGTSNEDTMLLTSNLSFSDTMWLMYE